MQLDEEHFWSHSSCCVGGVLAATPSSCSAAATVVSKMMVRLLKQLLHLKEEYEHELLFIAADHFEGRPCATVFNYTKDFSCSL